MVKVFARHLMAAVPVALLALSPHCAGAGEPDLLQLVTPGEVAHDAALARTAQSQASAKVVPKSAARNLAFDAPVIQIVAPTIHGPLKTPFPIRVSFQAPAGANINPATFKIFYGLFKLDITERVTKKAKVTAMGIEVEDANIPNGNHKLTLQVADTQGRVGETSLSFVVE